MRAAIVRTALAVGLLCAVASADSLSVEVREPPRPRPQVYALEGLGALSGVAGCGCLYAVGASLAFFGAWSGSVTASRVGVGVACASVAALPALAAYGTILVGERLDEHGSRGLAVGGAYAGGAVMAGALWLGVAAKWSAIAAGAAYAFPLAVPVGAVVGYNLSIPRRSVVGGIGERLQAPGVTFTSVEHLDHSVEYGVKVQLAGVRF